MRQKSPWVFLLLLPLFLFFLLATAAVAQIKVACVGDSITYGVKLKDPKHDSYPSQLGRLLGAGYEVHNYGHGGATLLKAGRLPYWNTREYSGSTKWKPNIVVIMLGTNDADPYNWKYKNQFVSNYKNLISHYANLPSHPKVYICLPPHMFNSTIQSYNLEHEVIPRIAEVGNETNSPVIDVNAITSNRREWFSFDGIHPNVQGASVIANLVYVNLVHARTQ